MKIFKILANYKDILALAAEVKLALADKNVSAEEAKVITQDFVDLLIKLGLLK